MKPHDLTPAATDCERYIIGASILSARIPDEARNLTVADFFTPHFRSTWAAILEIDATGQTLNHATIYETLKRIDPASSEFFTNAALVNTTWGMLHNDNYSPFVKAIKDAAFKRDLRRELSAQLESLDKSDVETIVGTLRRKLDEFGTVSATSGQFKILADIMDREVLPSLDELEQAVTRKISTGWDSIDTMIGGGISRSDVLLVAGLPGSGKSSFVLQLATNIAKRLIPVAFLSGEMSNRENAMRLLGQVSGFGNLNASLHLSASDKVFLRDWVGAIKDIPLYFDDKTTNLQTVGRSMRSLVENHQAQVLVIDYIQLLKVTPFDKHSRYERITEASQEVKRMAMELGVAVIEVAQFNREGAKSGKPMMHDLEGSSQLEKDTSLIFIIDREENQVDVTLRCVKGRNTGTGSIGGRFIGPRLTFEF